MAVNPSASFGVIQDVDASALAVDAVGADGFVAAPGSALRIDSATRRVIAACAAVPRGGGGGTWIVPEMIEAYGRWHDLGRVHSFETWIDGELAGGLYGVALGRMFFGESMFALRTDASKIALAALVAFCRAHGIETIDCQQRTVHLASFGGREIARSEFRRRLGTALAGSDVVDWSYDLSLWKQLGIGDLTESTGPSASEDTYP